MASPVKPRPPSIRHVARLAGVSIATVSRVFNAPHTVNAATRDRITGIASELGYTPSSLGRNLVHRRSHLMGLMVPTAAFELYGDIIHGIESVLDDVQMATVLVSSLDDPGHEATLARRLQRHAIDGGIAINARSGAALPAHQHAPWVHVAPEVPGLPYRVELDNEAGGALAARCLLDAGHQALAFIGASGRESAERERGFRREARRDVPTLTGDYGEASGVLCARALIAERPDVDGIFVAGDLMAAGVLRALHEQGRRIPQDVSVVGFDDARFAPLLFPRLTTIQQPAFELGRAAADMAVRLIAGDDPGPILLPPRLIVRESTRAPPP